MTAAFFLLLREGLEAALIVGIVCAYLVKLGRRDALRTVMIGVGAALALSAVVGLIVTLTVGRLPIAIQETLEGLAGLFAVAVLTWMLFWMRRQGRAMKGELEHGVDTALAQGTVTALAGLAFVAVAREGLETVLFLFALGAQTSTSSPRRSSARRSGWPSRSPSATGSSRPGIRIDLRRFFTCTGVILIFVSAGLVAFVDPRLRRGRAHRQPGRRVRPQRRPARRTARSGRCWPGSWAIARPRRRSSSSATSRYLIPVLILFVWGGRRPAPVASGPTGASGRAPA